MSYIEEEIEERKGMVVIGMISSGKSTFLNSIFGIDFLETNNDITTKFICAIRYNPKLKEPIFYNLKLVPKKDKSDEYIYIKSGEQYSGKDKIKNKISSINKNEHFFSEPKYENLFWMLEINKIIIENEEFMKTHDFYDIPGLNEYIKGDKNMNQENSNDSSNLINKPSEEEKKDLNPPPTVFQIIDNNSVEETKDIIDKTPKEEICDEDYKYIKGIFKYLKGKIENFIFIISTESCYKPQNLGIITEIRKNIDFDFEGGLFVLTKIDLSENKEKKIEECKQYFINKISSDIFNIDFNVFVPLNSIQFNIEMYMKKDIEYYFLYYYRQYYDNYVIVSGNKDIELKFIDFLENEIKKNIGEDQYEDFIDEAKENISIEDLNKIKKTYEEIKENTNQTIKFGINFEDDDDDNESLNILKGLYKLFKDKKYFPEISESTKEIINYFKNYQKETPNKDLKENKCKNISDLDINIEKLNNIFNKLKQYIDGDENDKHSNIAILNSNLRKLEKYIKNGKNIYIPFIGISSAGKSTTLNCLIGFHLFPESDKECTTRGIIIKYGKEVELYEVKVQTEKNFYVFEEDKLISRNIKNVQNYLKCLNYQYGKDESKYFYLIKTPIKLFDDYKFNDELKEKILLVDLPGCDTSDNKFNEHDKTERTVYEKLLDISSSFVFVNKNRSITDLDNRKILNNTYKTIYDNSSLGQNYLKNCLFVINMFTKLSDNEKDIVKIQHDLSNIIFDDKQEENNKEDNLKDINACLFNAKKYMEYLKERDKLCNKLYLFNEFKNNFIKKKKKKNFIKFFYDSLKTRCKDISMKIDENFECDNQFYLDTKKEILELMNISNIKYDESESKYFKNISNILSYINYKIKEIKLYVESYCEDFFSNLENQIRKAKNCVDGNYSVNIKECFKYFDLIFDKEIDKEKSFNQKYFKTQTEEIITELEKLENKYTIEKIFDYCMEKIANVFDEVKKDKEILISKYEKDIEKLIKNEIQDKINAILNEDLNFNIEKIMCELDKEIKKYKDKLLELFNMGLEKELKKGKYKAEIEVIIKFSFYEKLQLNLSKGFNWRSYGKVLSSISFILFSFMTFHLYGFIFASLIVLGSQIIGKFKSCSKILDEKIKEASKEYSANFERTRRNFSRLYRETLNESKTLFQDLLSIASIDLSKLEEVEWKILNKNYQEIKNNIYSISNNKIDLFN